MNRQQGFSLTELSIVLVIISLMMGSVLVLITGKTQDMQLNDTKATLRAVQDALATFVALQRRLPCPSDITVAVNTASFGAENCSSQLGGIPTKTLQLPDEYAFDAWNRRITYMVVSDCSSAATFATTSSCTGNNAGITVKNAAGTVILPSATAPGAAYVLVSFGQDGYGAWPHNGGLQIAYGSASTDEKENANGDTTYVQKSTTSDFDDLVAYGTQQQLIWESGGLNGMGGNATIPDTISPLCALIQTGNLTTSAGAVAACTVGLTSCSDALYSLATQVNSLCF